MKTLYSLPFRLFVLEGDTLLEEEQLNIEEIVNILEGTLINKEKRLIKKHNISRLVGFKAQLPKEYKNKLKISLSERELETVSHLIDSNYNDFKQTAFSIFSVKMKKREYVDIVISNTIKAIDEADETINKLSKRAGELASEFLPSRFYHSASISFNYERTFSMLSGLSLKKFNQLAEEDPLGKELDEKSFNIVKQMITASTEAIDFRASLLDSLTELLKGYCPNLLEVLGATIASRLISEAGSLRRLAFLPSSTIQVFGAEKAFFKHLRSKTKCPKYGYIFQHQFIQKTLPKKRGKAARFLADKISLCARCDYFTKKKIANEVKKQMETFREN